MTTAFGRWRARGLALLLGCAAASATWAQTLTLAVSRGPVTLPILVADGQGLFKREGVDVQLRDCSSGRQCFQWLAEGKVDMATAADLLTALSSFTRTDLAVIATVSTSSRQIKLVARRSAGINEPGQLAGKRIGTVGGSSAQFFLDRWLGFNAISPGEVTLVSLAPDYLVAALQQRQVDAIAIWEPVSGAAVAALGADALPLDGPRVYTQHFNLAAARPTIQRRGAELQRVLRALLRAQQLIADDPALAKAILRNRLALPAEAAETMLADNDFRVRLDQSLLSTMESQVRWAMREGLVDAQVKPVNLLRLVEPLLLRSVAPAAVGLVQ